MSRCELAVFVHPFFVFPRIVLGLVLLFVIAFIQTRPGWWAAPLSLRLFLFFLFVFLLALVLVGCALLLKLKEQSQARRCLLASRRQHLSLLQGTLALSQSSPPSLRLPLLHSSPSSHDTDGARHSRHTGSSRTKMKRRIPSSSLSPFRSTDKLVLCRTDCSNKAHRHALAKTSSMPTTLPALDPSTPFSFEAFSATSVEVDTKKDVFSFLRDRHHEKPGCRRLLLPLSETGSGVDAACGRERTEGPDRPSTFSPSRMPPAQILEKAVPEDGRGRRERRSSPSGELVENSGTRSTNGCGVRGVRPSDGRSDDSETDLPSWSVSPESVVENKEYSRKVKNRKALGDQEKELWVRRPWVLITGASSGVGLACAKAQLLRHQRVLALCRDLGETRRQLTPVLASLRRQLVGKKVFAAVPGRRADRSLHQEPPREAREDRGRTENLPVTDGDAGRFGRFLTPLRQSVHRREWRRDEERLLRQCHRSARPELTKTAAKASYERGELQSPGLITLECCIEAFIEWTSEDEGDVLTAALHMQNVGFNNETASVSALTLNDEEVGERTHTGDSEDADLTERNEQREKQTAELQSTRIVVLEVHRCDLRDLRDVLKASHRLRERVHSEGVRALVNNAAIAFCPFSKTRVSYHSRTGVGTEGKVYIHMAS